jgi:hypothetical protein
MYNVDNAEFGYGNKEKRFWQNDSFFHLEDENSSNR